MYPKYLVVCKEELATSVLVPATHGLFDHIEDAESYRKTVSPLRLPLIVTLDKPLYERFVIVPVGDWFRVVDNKTRSESALYSKTEAIHIKELGEAGELLGSFGIPDKGDHHA